MILEVKFEGIDDWNRPVFKSNNPKYSSLRFGSIVSLFDYDSKEEDVISKIKANELEYFGDKFGCEPHGGMFDGLELKIINSNSSNNFKQ